MEPRGYQTRAFDELRQAFREGSRYPLIVAPTGSGKTFMMATVVHGHVAKRCDAAVNWYAHRRELCRQAAETLDRMGVPVGYAGRNASAAVQVEMVQTALASGKLRACTFAVIDEAHHHGVTDDWARIMLGLKSSGATILGATATPERGDGRGLKEFDRLVVAAQVSELVDLWRTDNTQGLVPCEVLGPGHTLGRGKIAQLPVDAHMRYTPGRRNVVFAPHVKAAEEFAQQFRTKGIEAVVVHGKLSDTDRDRALARFASGEVRVLVNVYVLTEGWDCPAVDVVTLARSVGSIGMMVQMCGRGARPSPGKKGYTVLDLRGACRNPLIGRPDEDRDYSLDGIGISRKGMAGVRKCALCKRELGPDEAVCMVCGREVAELATPTATGDALERWEGKRRVDDPKDRAMQLAKWIARQPKAKPVAHKIRFKSVYGVWPDTETMNAAWKIAKG